MKQSKQVLCPCGAGVYAACCGRFLAQRTVPQTALELMRSRYTAYTMHDAAYLRATWHGESSPDSFSDEQQGLKWLGLEIRRHVQSGDEATVEFVARYKIGGKAQRLHEVSRFVREDGRWYYLDGSFPEVEQ